MTNAYELVEIAKSKQNIETDNALAIALGFTRQNVNDWKTGRSEPKGTNLLKLIKASGLSIDEALELMTDKPLKKTGFADIEMMLGLSGLSLLLVTASPYTLGLALSSATGLCILC